MTRLSRSTDPFGPKLLPPTTPSRRSDWIGLVSRRGSYIGIGTCLDGKDIDVSETRKSPSRRSDTERPSLRREVSVGRSAISRYIILVPLRTTGGPSWRRIPDPGPTCSEALAYPFYPTVWGAESP